METGASAVIGLSGQHILITGAAGGIGFDVGVKLLSLGCKITMMYNNDRGELDALATAHSASVAVVHANVTDEVSLSQLCDVCKAQVEQAFREGIEKVSSFGALKRYSLDP